MSSEQELRRLQQETWPDMNPLDQRMMGVHRTVRLEVPLHASTAIRESAKILRALADRIEQTYALQGKELSERSLILLLTDKLWAAQNRLNGLCPWRREYKRRMELLRQGSAGDTDGLSHYKG